MVIEVPSCKCGSGPDTWKFEYDVGEGRATFTCNVCGDIHHLNVVSTAFALPVEMKRVSCKKKCPNFEEKQKDEVRIKIINPEYYIVIRNGISEHIHKKFDCAACDRIKPVKRGSDDGSLADGQKTKQMKVI